MDKQLKKELKKVLTGQVLLGEEGVIHALGDEHHRVFHGAVEGWEAVQFRGLSKRVGRYRIGKDGESPFDRVFSAMQNLGRLVELKQAPETLACIRRYMSSRPVVIAVDYEGEGVICVTVYTGRGMFSGMICNRGLRDFCRALPSGELTPLGEKKTEKEQEKKRKKLQFKKKKAKGDPVG